ncbi:MAG: hypothetical protein ACRDJU_11755 [Actinomycetota bacterium]
MIRLGSLAGYSFEGPVPLSDWEPADSPGVFAVMYRQDPQVAQYAVIHAGPSDDLRAEGFPFGHPSAGCWEARAGSKEALLVAWFFVPGGTPRIRNGIAQELNAVYQPVCSWGVYAQLRDVEWTAEYRREWPWDDPPDPGGSGGVREPRHPRPSPNAGAAALAEPEG